MRSKIVAGNWKMNKNLVEAKSLASEIVHIAKDELNDDVKLVICPPFISLSAVSSIIGDTQKVFLGAQNCNDNKSGAYTGEISVDMLTSVCASYVIIGHSERREYYGETDAFLAKKVDTVLAASLTPIFCCGEPLEIREAETQYKYVTDQLTASLFHLSEDQITKIVIAYEPIWAIGTGKTASSAQAQEMHAEIRKHLASKYGKDLAAEISILYGGSCKASNAKEIFAGEDVDGGLIGGASLVAREFVDIAKSF
jgi:triosephosphate isomerase (TIM)